MLELVHLIMLASSANYHERVLVLATHTNEVDSFIRFAQLDSLGMDGKIQNYSDWIKSCKEIHFGRFRLVHWEGGEKGAHWSMMRWRMRRWWRPT